MFRKTMDSVFLCSLLVVLVLLLCRVYAIEKYCMGMKEQLNRIEVQVNRIEKKIPPPYMESGGCTIGGTCNIAPYTEQ